MKTDFPKITILGGGLLGGSLALALAEVNNPSQVCLWARNAETIRLAESVGISSSTTDLNIAVHEADLLILAVPVGSMPRLMAAAVLAGLPERCLVTDVGSVKSSPHKTLAPILKEKGNRFIGSHPMAGSEQNGILAASRDLFNGAACLMTNDDAAPSRLADALENLWISIGCKTTWMTASRHDELVARISHLPHLIAASAARVCLKDPSLGKFAGGGLRDTTRVAAGSPPMWAEILTENRSTLIDLVGETIRDLQDILACLTTADREKTLEWLEFAKQCRDPLNQSPVQS